MNASYSHPFQITKKSLWIKFSGGTGLGNGEPEHEKLTVDPRRTPEKVLPAYLSGQIAHLAGDPRTPTSPATR
jgi:hypothetical protein